MLQIADLSVRYGGITAVQALSVSVAEGELVALVGPNGAGKSSTLAAVSGLVAPAAGRILFDGESLVGLRPEEAVRRGVALVPEGRNIFVSLTVAENLALGATIRRDRRAVRHDVERELNRFPILRERYGQQAGYLSGGEQQQLAIARALLSRPRLLLLDEPSLGLAPLLVDAVFDTIAELRGSGMTVLLVEQNATRAVALADRSHVLRSGRAVRSGTAEDLGGAAALASEYLGATVEELSR
ncbi:ABC transporter ATP-binding protein [Pseudonocardia acidicola]|uniref:ABC transporter ATP-binding protein n=1 Tax=Pseudonocardia acidicola TaxID=2724939 RepID=A0ABX1SNH9_9PSEU|nr:ABC transporter ATP-binding protein [Pseudonocardia acidicola]NMI01840.1 ABC transporter ATP-binding protein [Pseudonocardia acidicola]